MIRNHLKDTTRIMELIENVVLYFTWNRNAFSRNVYFYLIIRS